MESYTFYWYQFSSCSYNLWYRIEYDSATERRLKQISEIGTLISEWFHCNKTSKKKSQTTPICRWPDSLFKIHYRVC